MCSRGGWSGTSDGSSRGTSLSRTSSLPYFLPYNSADRLLSRGYLTDETTTSPALADTPATPWKSLR
jgi:hypothetical protein